MKHFFYISLLLFISAEAFANNQFIPNHYKNRREMNTYSAIGWSTRNEAGLKVNKADYETESGGTKISESDLFVAQPYLFYRVSPNFNLEMALGILSAENTDLTPTPSTTDTDGHVLQLNAGYEFTDQPIAVGLTFAKSQVEFSSGDLDTTNLLVGLGYRLDNNMYLGAGISHSKVELGTLLDDSLESYSFGVGKVYGDKKAPVATTELVFTFSNEDGVKEKQLDFRGLWNHLDFQYYGSVGFAVSDSNNPGDENGSDFDFVFGVDYQFSDYYVGPQLEYTSEEDTDGDKTKDLSPSFQFGYRTASLELYIRYTLSDEEEEDASTLPTTNSEERSNQFDLAAIYRF